VEPNLWIPPEPPLRRSTRPPPCPWCVSQFRGLVHKSEFRKHADLPEVVAEELTPEEAEAAQGGGGGLTEVQLAPQRASWKYVPARQIAQPFDFPDL